VDGEHREVTGPEPVEDHAPLVRAPGRLPDREQASARARCEPIGVEVGDVGDDRRVEVVHPSELCGGGGGLLEDAVHAGRTVAYGATCVTKISSSTTPLPMRCDAAHPAGRRPAAATNRPPYGASLVASTAVRVGFIGLGAMGLPMARHLVEAGHTVTVASRGRSPIDAAVAFGAVEATVPRPWSRPPRSRSSACRTHRRWWRCSTGDR